MSLDLIVGCPVRDRSWIMPRWFDHVEAAIAYVGMDEVVYVFVGDPKDNTYQSIKDESVRVGRTALFVTFEEPGMNPHYRRQWGLERYQHMADLRNRLLDTVRKIDPPLFWSLDSDVLVARESLSLMMQAMETWGFDAVGGRMYMTPAGTQAPSYAYLTPLEEKLSRHENFTSVETVDVIMASKLLGRKALEFAKYGVHHQGEDIFFSKVLRENGLTLGYDGRVANRHVMAKNINLDVPDIRVGF